MADEYMTSTANAEFIPTIVATEAQLVFTDHTKNGLIGRSFDATSMLSGGGNKLDLPKIPAVELETETEGTPLEYAQFSSSKTTLTIDTKRAVVMAFTDYSLALENQDVLGPYGTQIGANSAKTVDAALAALYSSASISAITAGTGADIDEADILEAKSNLDEANAPDQGRYIAVKSDQYNALLALDRFTAAEKLGQEYISGGVLGRIHGFDVVEDNNLVATTDGFRHNVYGVSGGLTGSSLVHAFGQFRDPQAGAVASGQTPRIILGYDMKAGSHVLRGQIYFGVQVYRPEWFGTIKTRD
jgi:N4-gp56 family major capsid protein